jgi:hypothetical protein
MGENFTIAVISRKYPGLSLGEVGALPRGGTKSLTSGEEFCAKALTLMPSRRQMVSVVEERVVKSFIAVPVME